MRKQYSAAYKAEIVKELLKNEAFVSDGDALKVGEEIVQELAIVWVSRQERIVNDHTSDPANRAQIWRVPAM